MIVGWVICTHFETTVLIYAEYTLIPGIVNEKGGYKVSYGDTTE
jgi:hypothetical protein